MKKLLVVTPLALVGIFGVSWYLAASHVKSGTEAFISQLNNNKNVAISYDKISTTGFPFRVGSSIKNLKIKLATGEIIKSIPEDFMKTVAKNVTQSELDTVFSLENRGEFSGDVDITSNLLASEIKIKFGDGKIISKDNRGERIHFAKGDTFYTINFNRPAIETLLYKPFLLFDPQHLKLNNLESVKFEGKNGVFSDQENNLLVSAKNSLMFVEYKPTGSGQANYHLIAKIENETVGSEYIKSFAALDSYRIILKALDQKDLEISAVNNQNINFDFSATLPSAEFFSAIVGKDFSKLKSSEDSLKQVKLDLREFQMSSDAFSVDFSGEMRMNLVDSKNNFVSFHGHAQYFNPAFKKYVDEGSKDIANKIKSSNVIKHYFTEEKIKSVYPDLPSLGKLGFNIEIKSDEKNNIAINEFNLSSDLYSIDLSGSFGVNAGAVQNKLIDLKIKLKNHEALINDSIRYARKVVAMINADPELQNKIEISNDLESNVVALVNGMVEAPSSNDKEISINVKTVADGSITFGKLSNAAVVGELMKISQGIKGIPSNTQPNSAMGVDGTAMRMAFEANDRAIQYARGDGVEKDLKQAKRLFDSAAALGLKYAKINSHNLSTQKSYPAFIKVSDTSMSVTCEKYDHQSIDNFIATLREVGLNNISLIAPGQPHAIPEDLRAYTYEKAKAAGITIVN